MAVNNLIRNPKFSNNGKYWSTGSWYADNTIEFNSDNEYAKLTVRSEGDPGMCNIGQYVVLRAGTTYTITYQAKRTAEVDHWVRVWYGNTMLNSPSFKNQLVAGGSYYPVSYPFTIPGQQGDTVRVAINLIAGSAGGTVWVKDVAISAEKVYMPNEYIEVDASAPYYKKINDEQPAEHLKSGTKLLMSHVAENNTLAVKFGTDRGNTMLVYIPQQFCWSSGVTVDARGRKRMLDIATSLIGSHGNNIGLGGEYCQNFINWLKGAAECDDTTYYSDSGYCKDILKQYVKDGTYVCFDGINPVSAYWGDLVYYNVEWDESNHDITYVGHVGLIVDSDSEKYYAIEGNVGPVQNNTTSIAWVEGDLLTGEVTNDAHSRTASVIVRIISG